MHSALNVDLSLFASDGWKVILKVLKWEQKREHFQADSCMLVCGWLMGILFLISCKNLHVGK